MTHYDTLGVPKNATPDDIKKAFRKKAKDAHPDRAGGDDKKMASINKAYEVLSSPDKREQYDRTGSDAEPMSIEFQARDMLLQFLSKIIEDGGHGGILRKLRELLSMNRRGIDQNSDLVKAKVRKLEKSRGKVRVKKGDDLFEMTISDQLAKCNQNLLQMKQALAIMDCADAMVANWEEDAPAAARPDPYAALYSNAQQQMGWK